MDDDDNDEWLWLAGWLLFDDGKENGSGWTWIVVLVIIVIIGLCVLVH